MKDLVSYDSTAAESLLTQIKNFFMSKGIVMTKKFGGAKSQQNQSSPADYALWIKPFIIQTNEPAFYLDIDSPDDVAATRADLEKRLTDLQGKIKTFLQNNNDLDENLLSKIQTLANANLSRAIKATQFGLKNKLASDVKKCNSVNDLQDIASRRYREFFEKEFLERIIVPLYEGLRQNPKETAYLWILQEVNNFLADLGVMTVDISIGDFYDEKKPYEPSEESRSAITTDAADKDKIREVLRYAYAFQEDKGAENSVIMLGKVIVAVYQAGGAK